MKPGIWRQLRLFVVALILLSANGAFIEATPPLLAQDGSTGFETAETNLEQARAQAAEENPTVLPAVSREFTLHATQYPLFIGVDDTTVPAYQIDVTNSVAITAFVGFQVWGAAYDAVNDKVYFNGGSTLYEWPVGGAVTPLGTITDVTGTQQSMVGLAFYDGMLYATKNIANEAIWAVDPGTLIATVHIDYVDADLDCGGFSADPDTGTFYCTNDDTMPHGAGLVIINPDASVTPVAAYPAGQTDIDGLAVSDDGFAYLVIDEPGSIYVWDFVAGAYATPLNNPWATAEVFSAGAWIPTGVQTPTVTLTKTVVTTPGVCATTNDITVIEGTEVYYCYEVTNTGDVTLNLHDLVDDQLGPIFTGLNYALTPGSSIDTVAAGLSIPAIISVTTVNTATWTAYNAAGPSVTATDSARVIVEPSAVSVTGMRANTSGVWSIALLSAFALGGFVWRRRQR